MWTRTWLISIILYLNGFVQLTIAACGGDTTGVVQGGQTCAQLVAADDANCYNSTVETLCCDSCGNVATGNPACQYGDHITCYSFLCTSYNPVSQCCQTCVAYMPATTAGPTQPPTTTSAAPPPTTTTTSGPVTSSQLGGSSGVSTENGGNQGGVIAGAVVGALVGVVLCVVAAIVLVKMCGRKSRRQKRKIDPDDGSVGWGSRTSIHDKGAPPDQHPPPSHPPPMPPMASHHPMTAPTNRRQSDPPPLPFITDGNLGGMLKPVPPIATLYQNSFITSNNNVTNDDSDLFGDIPNETAMPIPEKSSLSVGTLGSLQFKNGDTQSDKEFISETKQTETQAEEILSRNGGSNSASSALFTGEDEVEPNRSIVTKVSNDVTSQPHQSINDPSSFTGHNLSPRKLKPSGFLFPDL